mmetsp:Transcript_50359/g.157292  ORF Transcript_50359/g.157292 Transcript_50359/m.157292 type:complete len:164 (-) Transcript_50359:1178-1669(-)
MLHSKLNSQFDMSALTSVYSTKEMSLSHRLGRLLDLKREAYTLTREDMARTVSRGNEKLSRPSVVRGIAGIAAPQPYEVSEAAGVPRHARQSHLSLLDVLDNPRMLQSLLRCGSLRDVDANQPPHKVFCFRRDLDVIRKFKISFLHAVDHVHIAVAIERILTA